MHKIHGALISVSIMLLASMITVPTMISKSIPPITLVPSAYAQSAGFKQLYLNCKPENNCKSAIWTGGIDPKGIPDCYNKAKTTIVLGVCFHNSHPVVVEEWQCENMDDNFFALMCIQGPPDCEESAKKLRDEFKTLKERLMNLASTSRFEDPGKIKKALLDEYENLKKRWEDLKDKCAKQRIDIGTLDGNEPPVKMPPRTPEEEREDQQARKKHLLELADDYDLRAAGAKDWAEELDFHSTLASINMGIIGGSLAGLLAAVEAPILVAAEGGALLGTESSIAGGAALLGTEGGMIGGGFILGLGSDFIPPSTTYSNMADRYLEYSFEWKKAAEEAREEANRIGN